MDFAVLPQAAFPANFSFPALKPGTAIMALHNSGIRCALDIPNTRRLSKWNSICKWNWLFFVAKQHGLGARQGGGAGPSRLTGRRAYASNYPDLMCAKSARPTCTIAPILYVRETRPAYMHNYPNSLCT